MRASGPLAMEFLRRPPGANPATVAELAAKFSVTLPEDLLAFWQYSDGAVLWFGHKELQFFPVDEIVRHDVYSVSRFMPRAMPICTDGCGNLCVARIDAGKVTGYFVASCGNLGWDDAVELATTFGQFIDDPKSPEQRLYHE